MNWDWQRNGTYFSGTAFKYMTALNLALGVMFLLWAVRADGSGMWWHLALSVGNFGVVGLMTGRAAGWLGSARSSEQDSADSGSSGLA